MTQTQPFAGFVPSGFRYPAGGLAAVGGLGVDSRVITGSIGASVQAAGKMLLAAHPLAGAITLAAGALISLVGSLFRPDITKIETTRIVDQIEAEVLKPLRAEWNGLPAAAKTIDAQTAALMIFDNAWAAVERGCNNPAFGDAGAHCIADRAAGACHWTIDGATPGAPPDCGNWFVWYRDPIATDPEVAANLAAAEFAGATPAGSGSSTGSPAAAAGGALTPPASKAYLWGGLVLIGLALALAVGGDA